jgi:hypothetical protein
MAADANGSVDIPKTCPAGVVVNEGPDFHLAVEDVPVPEPGKQSFIIFLMGTPNNPSLPLTPTRTERCLDQAQHNRNLLLRHPLHAQ